ncbi:MAG TPA: ABC transporter permease [Armatimonadota bacterium]|nr:ABC transporter permease [Armatimonadota bacterium]
MRMTPLIAFRHLRTRLRSALLTSLGVALGVTVMSTMSSMLLGLQSQFIESVVENTPNITIDEENTARESRVIAVPTNGNTIVALSRRPPPERRHGIVGYHQLNQQIEQVSGIIAAAPELTGQVVVRYGTRGLSATLTGVIPERQARAVAWQSRLRKVHGQLETRSNGAILGVELAKNLGIPPDAYVTLVAGPEHRQRVRVLAFYDSGIRQVDETAVFTNLSLAQTLLDRPSQVNEIAVRVRDINAAPQLATQLQMMTGFRARSWQEVNSTFFSIFRLQNTMTVIMITFIVTIAGFGISNGLITLILAKQRDIGILKALGTTADRIVAIFLLEGILMGVIGSLLGIGLSAISINYLDQLPLGGQGELSTATTFTMLRVPGVYLIPALIAVVVSIAASLLPVRRAAGYDPVVIIRGAK